MSPWGSGASEALELFLLTCSGGSGSALHLPWVSIFNSSPRQFPLRWLCWAAWYHWYQRSRQHIGVKACRMPQSIGAPPLTDHILFMTIASEIMKLDNSIQTSTEVLSPCLHWSNLGISGWRSMFGQNFGFGVARTPDVGRLEHGTFQDLAP